MKKIGFIGIGVMGSAMALNLMKKGFEVSVYTRTKSKADKLISQGAQWCGSVGECARNKDAVITIVGYPKDVEEVYFGENGIIENAKAAELMLKAYETKEIQTLLDTMDLAVFGR